MEAGRKRRRWPGRLAVVGAIALIGVGAYGAFSLATGEQPPANGPSARDLLGKGRALNDEGRNRKASKVLRRAVKMFDGSTQRRVRATAYFELGVALRGSGRFEKAKKPLRKAKRLGISPGAVGLQLAKANAGIRN